MDAFIVALSQASEGGRQRWYESTYTGATAGVAGVVQECPDLARARPRMYTPQLVVSSPNPDPTDYTRLEEIARFESRASRAGCRVDVVFSDGRSGAGCSRRAVDKSVFSGPDAE